MPMERYDKGDLLGGMEVTRIRIGIILGPWVGCSLVLSTALLVASQHKLAHEARLSRPSEPALSEARPVAADSSVMLQPEDLVPVFERLTQMSAGRAGSAVHIIHFGDSHTTSDDLTGQIRELLKKQFGDGGSGFSLAGHPFRDYRRFDVQSGASPGWIPAGLRSPGQDGYYGLGGVSISTRSAGQSTFITTECDHLEIHYLQQPGGGEVALFDGDKLLRRFSTAGDLAPGVSQYQLEPGHHRFLLKTMTSSPVRLFGWVAEKDSGVTYEALGIDGVDASIILRWDERMFETYLASRNPQLIVLAYGTNEAVDRSWSPKRYEAMFSRLLQKIRRDAPAASILVVGPPDSCSRSHGTVCPAVGLEGIIRAQQNACRENGCAFWDVQRYMGGPGAMPNWARTGLAQNDYIHLTPAGYRRVATALFTEIMRLYKKFLEIRLQISASDTGLLMPNQ